MHHNRIAHLFDPAEEPLMPRRKGPEKRQVGTYIPVKLHDALRAESDRSGVPIARLIEDAVRMLLDRRAADDRIEEMMDRTIREIEEEA
jgi:hypothetical protein